MYFLKFAKIDTSKIIFGDSDGKFFLWLMRSHTSYSWLWNCNTTYITSIFNFIQANELWIESIHNNRSITDDASSDNSIVDVGGRHLNQSKHNICLFHLILLSHYVKRNYNTYILFCETFIATCLYPHNCWVKGILWRIYILLYNIQNPDKVEHTHSK